MEDQYSNAPGQSGYGTADGGAGTAARMQPSEIASDVKAKATDLGRRAVDTLDGSRGTAADTLQQTASTIHSGTEQASAAAHAAADKLELAADYIRDTDMKGMAADLQDIVKRYPGPALAVAATLGFLVARGFRRSD